MNGREQVRLTRRFILEAAHIAADDSGGFVTWWCSLGTLWAAMRGQSGREVTGQAGPLSQMRVQIIVRAAPYNASNRPKPGQRFRDANRCFHMSLFSASLQRAVLTRLEADSEVAALTEGHVYDALPPGELPILYVIFGTETVRDRSDMTSFAAVHEFDLSVITSLSGFQSAKTLASYMCTALLTKPLSLADGHLIALNFQGAVSKRQSTGGGRRIDLKFRALIEQKPPLLKENTI